MEIIMAILEMKHISKSFFGVYANEDITFCVEAGEIHALLGENGAGKTTLMNILFGLYKADKGEIIWQGNKVSFHSPKDAINAGIGMVHQHFSLVNAMTVVDNIILGMQSDGLFIKKKKAKEKIKQYSKQYNLQVNPDAYVETLSVGERQRVEILKSLYRGAKLLILDEPTGVLTPEETTTFFEVLRKLKKEGHGIIIITHRMNEIMEISDRVTILRNGKLVNTVVTKETTKEQLSIKMIGAELEKREYIPSMEKGKVVLQLQNVCLKKKRNPLENINLQIHEGEIVGVAGVEGNGQKDLAEVITGIQKHTKGSIEFLQEPLEKQSVRTRFEKGISYISDDRHNDGLIMDMSVMENLALRAYRGLPFSKFCFLNKRKMEEIGKKVIETYQVKTSGTLKEATPVKLLSGGNQQKVIIAREVCDTAKLIIANQPTRGLDIGAIDFVRTTLVEQKKKGKSVLLISADLEEILELSDRIAVMFGGKIVGILDGKTATRQKIGLLMGGVIKEDMEQ